jgi:membrane-bound lytic murein transglycosylase MltF
MLTSMVTNAAFAPQMAVPVEVKTLSPLEQVSAKEFSKALLTEKQYRCFTKLIGKESAWNHKAKNPTSTARGIGQLLEATYTNLGMKHSDNAVAQTVAALAYIGRKYGSGGPCAAWAHWQKNKWY